MKIGVDISMLARLKTGIGHYVASLLKEMTLLANQHEFILYTNAPLDDFSVPQNSSVRLSNHAIRLLWMQTILPKQLKEDQTDLFFGGNFALPLLPGHLKKVAAIHDFVFRRYPETLPTATVAHLKLMIPLYLRSADHVLVNSACTAKDLVEYYNYPQKNTTIVPLAARNSFFVELDNKEVNTVLEDYGLKRGYILFVGTVEPRKGLSTVFEALSICRSRSEYCPHLIIIGKIGWKSDHLKELQVKFSLENAVTFLNYVPEADLPALYRGAAIFVYPSLYEGFGLPLLEAMASGVPTITTNSSSLPEVGGDAVLYIEPGDAAGLASLIEKVTTDQTMQENLINRGRNRAQQFSWQHTAEQTMSVFENVMKNA